MVTKSYTCPNGHQWKIADAGNHPRCPVCGAESAETIGNGHEQSGSTGIVPSEVVAAASKEARHARFGRYQIIEELGRGGMGIVYRAFDPVHQRQVALKTLPNTDPTLLSRFKREFRVLAGVDHPHVAKLFELTADGETWFFTMELVDGVDLLHYVKNGGSDRSAADPDRAVLKSDSAQQITLAIHPFQQSAEQIQRLREGLAQLTEAIAALHANGIIHRDIKPSNVIVMPDGRVVLLDFGLIAETDSSGSHKSLHQQLMGTVAYMSPEQAACDSVSPASDWYSVGVMLYQALTGRLPFSGKNLDVLASKQKQDPMPPRAIQPSVDQDLNDLCMQLLCRVPEGRPGAKEILRRLGKQPRDQVPTREPQPNRLTLVGRESQLGILHTTYQAMLGGQAQIVFVQGRSGDGKSALAEAFIEQTTREGAVVLKGRCYEMETVPFKAIDSLIDSLVTHLRHMSQAEAEALMPRDIQALARLFPVIGQIEAVASLPRRHIDVSDQQELNRRAIGALRELLARMGDRCPLVVYIDDLQWGDEDSAAMVLDLLQPPDPPVLLFLGTYRSEDAETSQFLQSFRKIQRQREFPLASVQIEVRPLEHSDAVTLALTLLQRDDEDARRSAESIAQESAGNPFFVAELVKQLQLGEGHVDDSARKPSALFDMIWSRVQRLPEDSQRLLAVVALRGQPLPLDQALRIADVGQSAVGPLRSSHLIRTVGLASSSKIETYHDRVRESVFQRLDTATKQRHHLRIAEEFAAGPAPIDDPLETVPVWFDVAFHYDAAGRPDLAFPYALATAEKARTRFSLEVAEQQYRIAERGVDGQDQGVKYRVAEGLGDVLMLRGRYRPAAQYFEAASLLAKANFTRAQIEGKLGVLAFKRGDDKSAAEAMERSLRLLGHKVPSHSAVFALLLLWEVFVQLLHSIFPKRFLARRILEGAERELLAVRLYIDLSYAYFFDRKVPTFWAHLRALNLAERYSAARVLSHAWASHGPAMALIPWLRRGEVYVKKSLEVRKETGDVCAQGQSLHYLGVVLFAWAKYDECISACREAVRLLERTGDFWERNMAWWQGANAVFRKGDLARAASEAQRLYEACVEMGDNKISRFALDIWSRASGGRVPADVVERELQKERNNVWATALALLADAVRRVRKDELDEAIEALTQAYDMCRDTGMNAWVGPILPWMATVRRLQSQKSTDPHRRRQLLAGAGRAARQALAVARKFQTDLPHALREAGLISAMQGSVRRARKNLDESLRVAERQSAKFEYAQTLLVRGSVGMTLGWPGAAEEVAAAQQRLIELGADFALAHYVVRDKDERL